MTEIAPWFIAFAAGAVFWLWTRRLAERWIRKRRAARAARGERRAERLLLSQGWKLVDRQVRRSCTLRAGDRDVHFELIADLIVEKNGEHMIAEVKTGAGRNISHAGTRRQLLEYLLAFDVDGILLVDAIGRQITPIEFHLHKTDQRAA